MTCLLTVDHIQIPSPRTQHLYPNIQPQTQFQDPVTTEAAHTNGYVLHPQVYLSALLDINLNCWRVHGLELCDHFERTVVLQIIHIPPQMDMLDETGRALMLDRNRPLYGSGANTRRRRFTPTQAQVSYHTVPNTRGRNLTAEW
jgi:hypothetical protein